MNWLLQTDFNMRLSCMNRCVAEKRFRVASRTFLSPILAIATYALSAVMQEAHAANSQDAEDVKKAFVALRQSVLKGECDKAIASLSPNTMALFNRCGKLASAPDTTSLTSLSQFEVLIGFQAYWQLSRHDTHSMSATNLFEWAWQQGLINMRGIVNVELEDITVKGTRATARVKNDDKTSAETRISFTSSGDKWKLNLDEILLFPEQRLAEFRTKEGLNKAELAVVIIERASGKPIPRLRELLIPPYVRTLVTQLRGKEPARVYDRVLAELGDGRQSEAEQVLEMFVAIHTNDQRLAFAQAVCSRSRFAKTRADAQFKQVLWMDPMTLEGNCARYVLDLDARKHVPDNMNALRLLIRKAPDNPLLLWTLAIECREHYNLTKETTYSQEAAQCYRDLLKIFKVGPVLLHQTFANVLSEELDRDEEALAHRRIAVALEPAPWTYQGLANTLSFLKQFTEANEVFAKLVELDPCDANYWRNWAASLSHQERYEECIKKNMKAIECDASCFEAYNSWGFCLEQQGKYSEAIEKYEKAKTLNPADRYAYGACARVLALQGKGAEAQHARTQQDMIPTRHTGFVSTNLTDATRPAFLGQLKGADLQTLSSVFGKPALSTPMGFNVTDYTIRKWHDWSSITLRLHQDEGLETLIAYSYKGAQTSLAEWREALWRDFGIKIDRIRITKKSDPYNVYYEVECLDSAPNVKWIGFRVSEKNIRDLHGTTTIALTDWGFVSSEFMILFWDKPGEMIKKQ